MTKEFDLCGFGACLVDVFCDVPDSFLGSRGLEKGTMRLVDTAEQEELLGSLGEHAPRRCSGGSVANSCILHSQLGGKVAFMGRVGKDFNGDFYRGECEQLGVHFPMAGTPLERTGTSVCLISSDAERTMRTALGAAGHIKADDLVLDAVTKSQWVFLEGYQMVNLEDSSAIFERLTEAAQRVDTAIALTLSEPWVVKMRQDLLTSVLERVSLLFANEEEALAVTGSSDIKQAIDALVSKYRYVVVTLGAKGVVIGVEGKAVSIPAFDCSPVDLTGAGDAMAGSYLFGLTHLNLHKGISPADAAAAGCFLASKVITQVGARLSGDVKALWSGVVNRK